MTRPPAPAGLQSGQALVEFALVIPVFLLALVGIFDVGRMVYTNSALSQAAREGARLAPPRLHWIGITAPGCVSYCERHRSGNPGAHVCPTTSPRSDHVDEAVNRMAVSLGPLTAVHLSCNAGSTDDLTPSGDWTEGRPRQRLPDARGRPSAPTATQFRTDRIHLLAPHPDLQLPDRSGAAERLGHDGHRLGGQMHAPSRSQRGQVMTLFAFGLVGLVLGAAVVVDGGFAFAQRRVAQNAADFAAMAGTRIVGVSKTDRPAGSGSADNVEAAIESVLEANDAELVSAQYVDASATRSAHVVGAGSIPSAPSAWSSTLAPTGDPSCWGSSASPTGRRRPRPRPSRRAQHRRRGHAGRHPGRGATMTSTVPPPGPARLRREPHLRTAQHPGRFRLALLRVAGPGRQVRLDRQPGDARRRWLQDDPALP